MVKRLQFKFHTWCPIAHSSCAPGTCTMHMDLDASTSISICSKDSINVHICEPERCKFRHALYASNDVVCALTGMVVRRNTDVAEFIPHNTRTSRYNIENQERSILSVISIIVDECPWSDEKLQLRSATSSIYRIIILLWNLIGAARPTPRQMLFFTTTCINMLKDGMVPNNILPAISQFRYFHTPSVIAALCRAQPIKFHSKTLSDYYASSQSQIRYHFFSLGLVFSVLPSQIPTLECQNIQRRIRDVLSKTALVWSDPLAYIGVPMR